MHLSLICPTIFMLALAASTCTALPHNLGRESVIGDPPANGGGVTGSGTPEDSNSSVSFPSPSEKNDLIHLNLLEANALFFVMWGMQQEYEATIDSDASHANSLCTQTLLQDLSIKANSTSSNCPWSYNMADCTFNDLRYPHYVINASCHTHVRCSSAACSASLNGYCLENNERIYFLKRDSRDTPWKMPRDQDTPDYIHTSCGCR